MLVRSAKRCSAKRQACVDAYLRLRAEATILRRSGEMGARNGSPLSAGTFPVYLNPMRPVALASSMVPSVPSQTLKNLGKAYWQVVLGSVRQVRPCSSNDRQNAVAPSVISASCLAAWSGVLDLTGWPTSSNFQDTTITTIVRARPRPHAARSCQPNLRKKRPRLARRSTHTPSQQTPAPVASAGAHSLSVRSGLLEVY